MKPLELRTIFPTLLSLLLLVGFISCSKDDVLEEEQIPKIVINELLPKNDSHGSDGDGDFDDWIEIFIPADVDQDISGDYLSDSKNTHAIRQFAECTSIDKHVFQIYSA